MTSVANLNRTLRLILLVVLILIIGLALLVVSTHGQSRTPSLPGAQAPAPDAPVFTNYKGVTVGMTAEAVHQKLGLPSEPGAQQDFYFFSETESAQVYYDPAQKVRAVSINYLGDSAPTARQVLGVDVQPNPDGSLNKLVHYEQAGYWVAYGRTAGPSPLVTVTIQRIITAP